MTAPELYLEATRRGLRLEPRGDKLAVIPGDRVPPEFANVLREHKGELLDWLKDQAANLRLDEIPWLHVANQILAGEFDGADRSTVQSLTIGLRSIRHPLCRQALAVIKSAMPANRTPDSRYPMSGSHRPKESIRFPPRTGYREVAAYPSDLIRKSDVPPQYEIKNLFH